MTDNHNSLIVIAIVVVIVGFFAYAIFAKLKRRDASWTGTVIDKNVTETATAPINTNNNQSGIVLGGNRNAINSNYNLRIKSDAGKEFNWPVGQGFYESVQVGDKLTKSPGTEIPTKL